MRRVTAFDDRENMSRNVSIVIKTVFLMAVIFVGSERYARSDQPVNLSAALNADQAHPLEDMTLGADSAPVTIIEYGSMTCVHCSAFHRDVFPKLKSSFIESGKVRFVFREFPLDIKAAAGSMVARCVADGNPQRYFAMVDVLFRMQDEWAFKKSSDGLISLAKQAALSEDDFKKCLTNNDMLADIKQTRQYAADKLGVDSTPTFFINGVRYEGEMTPDDLEATINTQLNSNLTK